MPPPDPSSSAARIAAAAPALGPVTRGWAVFATAIGHCGLAWAPAGLQGVLLPQADGAADGLRTRLQRRHPALPEVAWPQHPASVGTAIDGIRALLAGAPLDLLDIVLDESRICAFHRRVYAVTRRIPPGQVRTYGDVADELGDRTLARAVGQALGANPFAPVVPCHRVMGARGWQGGFSAPGGVALKLHMLQIEGARPGGQGTLF